LGFSAEDTKINIRGGLGGEQKINVGGGWGGGGGAVGERRLSERLLSDIQ